MIKKIDFECHILAPFDTSAFLAQSLANCVSLPLKRDNSYYHNQDSYRLNLLIQLGFFMKEMSSQIQGHAHFHAAPLNRGERL